MLLTCIVPDLVWHAQQSLKFGPISLTTRMTVIRLQDGTLWVHSPISPTIELVEDLQKIGTVSYVVAPNKSHHLFFLSFVNVFPSAQAFIAAGLQIKRPELSQFPAISDKGPWRYDIQSFFIEGLPLLNETVFFHTASGTLILTDLLFYFANTNKGLAALITKLLGVRGQLGMSRTMKLAIRDRQALARSVAPLLSLPIQRVIVAHDEIITEQAAAKLRQAFLFLT